MTLDEKAEEIQKQMHQTIEWCQLMASTRTIKINTEYSDYVTTFIVRKLAEIEIRLDELTTLHRDK